ncbi:MAG: glycosyltransferase family 2 protein [Bryobacterales bacterium]|nr:glycosyltransferase family 2 protein [Bryobacterales bacterium]MDE0622297.1 glycosyltransferase family 2 protein [Bryobacterales bacterium]
MRITATIITRDEQDNIARAIRSVGFCEEVLVVDSGSTDQTVAIAKSLGATVICKDWPGYAAQKNFAAGQARHDWILSLDADEAVTPRLATSIQLLTTASGRCAGYDFPRLARYCGRWIRHSGWYPDRKVRLYDRTRGRWVGRYVHESVRLDGERGHLDGDLLHYTCDSIEAHRANLERYTDLAARELRESGKRVGALRPVFAPIHSFVKAYVLQFGFLDGRAGIAIARMAARYVYLKYSKARLLARR